MCSVVEQYETNGAWREVAGDEHAGKRIRIVGVRNWPRATVEAWQETVPGTSYFVMASLIDSTADLRLSATPVGI